MQKLSTLLILLLVGFLCWQGYLFYHDTFPNTAILAKQYPIVRYKGPKAPFEVVMQKQKPAHWADLPEISKAAQGAVLVSEDWAFFQHKGYDPNQIKEAIEEDFSKGKISRGASTITQQVVKNVFLERDRTFWRKFKEFILAVRLERSVSKRKILETYFNIAEWGEGTFGIRAAAQFYFNKPPSELTAKEGAFLAMLLPSPKRYSQSFRAKTLTPYASKTIQNILRNMTRAGYLSEEERQIIASQPLSFESPADSLEHPQVLEPEPDPEERGEEVPKIETPDLNGT